MDWEAGVGCSYSAVINEIGGVFVIVHHYGVSRGGTSEMLSQHREGIESGIVIL